MRCYTWSSTWKRIHQLVLVFGELIQYFYKKRIFAISYTLACRPFIIDAYTHPSYLLQNNGIWSTKKLKSLLGSIDVNMPTRGKSICKLYSLSVNAFYEIISLTVHCKSTYLGSRLKLRIYRRNLLTMRLNVNGFISPGFRLGCGLRQGDPISPLLFNLVLESFIRSILSDGRTYGFDGPAPSLRTLSAPVQGSPTLHPLKVLA